MLIFSPPTQFTFILAIYSAPGIYKINSSNTKHFLLIDGRRGALIVYIHSPYNDGVGGWRCKSNPRIIYKYDVNQTDKWTGFAV